MNKPQPPPGITAQDWAATPAAVQTLVRALLEVVATVEPLKQRVAELEARLNQTSRNSSRPPSSDPPSAPPRPPSVPSGRKTGGQPGHPGRGRSLKPVEDVDRLIDLTPESCARCGSLLLGEDPEPERHQVTDLPRIVPVVTEYRRHRLWCVVCGAETQAAWPVEMPAGSFGPRLQATVGYLTGRIGASQREVREVLATVCHTEVSVGSIATLEQAVSTALAAPMAEALHYVQRQPVRNADETGWYERAKRLWLWISATPLVTVFRLLTTRGAAGAEELLGKDFPGVVGTDRYGAYSWVDPRQRQLCWAHLKREFMAWSERGDAVAWLGQALLAAEAQVFRLWYCVRDGTLSWADFQVAMLPVRARVGTLLREGAEVAHKPTQRTCRNLVKLEAALWTFVWEEGVEPTNNSAERPLRRAVLWRRRSFGTQSAAGSQFVERILTAVTTLRQQQRDVLEYLTAACAAATCGEPPPSLLASSRPTASVS
jgi:transposase